MIRAAVFDLDGLLVDSEPVWFRVRTEMFQRYNLVWTVDDQKALMGRSTQRWIDDVHTKLGGRLSREEVTRHTLDAMAESYGSGRVRVMPGAQHALEYCKKTMVLGLASGSPRVLIEAALDSNGWRKYFEEVMSSDDVPNGKPAPDVYLRTMDRLRVKPADCVVLEDSGSGILAGKAAGAKVIAVPNAELMPSPDALSKADVAIPSLEKIEGAIQLLESRA